MKGTLVCSLAILLTIGLSLSLSSKHADAKLVGAWLFDEDGGDIAVDSSNEGNDGVFVGGPERVDDAPFGKALKVQPGKYVDFPPPTPEVLMLEKDFTCMAWFKANQWIAGWQCVFSMQAGSTGGEIYGIYFGNQGGKKILLWTRINGAGQNITTGQGGLDLGKWTHGAVTYNGSQMILYKNGEEAAKKPLAGNLDNGDRKGRFVINGNYNSLNGGLAEFADATIDEVIIFDEALPQSKIKELVDKGFVATLAVQPSSKLAVAWGALKVGR